MPSLRDLRQQADRIRDWNEELLRLELGDLQVAGFDLALTGFDQDELDRLLVIEPDGW